MKVNRHKAADACRAAARLFAADALAVGSDTSMNPEARQRLAAGFEQQARETRELADAIENADRIEFED